MSALLTPTWQTLGWPLGSLGPGHTGESAGAAEGKAQSRLGMRRAASHSGDPSPESAEPRGSRPRVWERSVGTRPWQPSSCSRQPTFSCRKRTKARSW